MTTTQPSATEPSATQPSAGAVDLEQLAADVRRLVDRQEIADVLYRYASAVDTKDFATLRSLFVDDAHGQYTTVADLHGADDIVTWIDGMTDTKTWQHHKVTVYHIDFAGPDEARTLTYHTSHQTDAGDPGAVTVIVARYHDTLRRTPAGWKITEKIMESGWAERRVPEIADH